MMHLFVSGFTVCTSFRLAIQKLGSVTCAADETPGIISWLHVLPELAVGVVEDVCVVVQVVEALRGQHHAHIVTAVKQRQRAQEELWLCHLVRVKDAQDL